MQLNKLYEIQAGLKAHIDYKGEDKFSRMMLAMIVEFGECANDWQQFKYWKKNNEPKETLLEEYVDGLHFVLEAGLDLVEMGLIDELPATSYWMIYPEDRTITDQFKTVIISVLQLDNEAAMEVGTAHKDIVKMTYKRLLENFLTLGHMLGFTLEQIENAYLEKNAENHARQQRGY